MKRGRMKRIGVGAFATLAIASLVGCSSSPAGGQSGVASQIVVGSYGGDYDNFHKQFVVPAYNKEFDGKAPSVVFDSSDANARVTKVLAQKAAKSGAFDVVMQSDPDIPRLTAAGALDKLDLSKIPNASHALKNLTNPYCVPQIYSAEEIIYNKDKVAAPTSWNVFWDPKYKGKIGVVSTIWQQWFFVASAAMKSGNPGDDWTVGADKLGQLAGSVRVYGSQDQLGQAMVSGEIWLTENRKARAFQWNDAAGGTIASALPTEGTIPTTFYACIPANAPHKDEAYKYLNALLEPAAQSGFAEKMGYAPTVDNASLSGDVAGKIGFTQQEASRIFSVDWDAAAKHYVDEQKIWQRDVTR
jgi:putative spermidine/putrescine transport system substrate-binding protein